MFVQIKSVYEEFDDNKTNAEQECIICHYLYLLEIDFTFQPKVCYGCFNENHKHYY